MALDNKKSGFNFDLDERLKDKVGIGDTDAPTYTYTDTHTGADIEQKENKTKRTYGLVKPSVHEKVTKYAKANNTSYNDIVCELLEKFIEEKEL